MKDVLRSWLMINFIVSFTGSGSVVGQIHGYKKSFTDGRGEGNICIAYSTKTVITAKPRI